jgi:cation diffusion facilitator family transporter
LTKFLLKLATGQKDKYTDKEIRLRTGYMASIVGLFVNIILSIVKLIIGFTISSIGVIADGFNNITDSASSIITLVGFKLSSMPADKEHPYGHGRIEYISALMVAFLVMLVGFQFIMSSAKKIINPTPVEFQIIPFIILVLSITSKIWLSKFNKNIGEEINSKSLKAAGVDAMGDVLTTSVVVVSIVLSQFTTLPLDGIIGVVISLLIIYAGYSLVKETISPLIGEAPPRELIHAINEEVMSYDYITGVHDLVIHSYGEEKVMAVIDAEFPANIDILKVHEEITKAEREVGEKYNLTLVIHMDPLGEESEERYKLRNEIKHIVKKNPIYKSMHDFNILEEENEEIAEFHIVIDGEKIGKNENMDTIKEDIEEILEEKCTKIKCNVIVDIEYD